MAMMFFANITGKVRKGNVITGNASSSDSIMGVVSHGPTNNCKMYSGDYEVTPKIQEQVLNTYDRHMNDDVTIKAIPYFEVSNEQGQTVIIGG